jgi:hypothetical protein
LQFAHVRKTDLRKQAKGLRKVHLQDCLIKSQEKQKCQREESKSMWFLIKRTVKDPQSPSVLCVQRVVSGKVKEYVTQEDVEKSI